MKSLPLKELYNVSQYLNKRDWIKYAKVALTGKQVSRCTPVVVDKKELSKHTKEDTEKILCPKCKSDDVFFDHYLRNKCNECGENWN
jgi:ribosomal protein L37AE/L43A